MEPGLHGRSPRGRHALPHAERDRPPHADLCRDRGGARIQLGRRDRAPKLLDPNAFDAWAWGRAIAVHFITPGKPTENGIVESFNGKLRDECMNASWFERIEDAKVGIESWRRDYNARRPHSALGNATPEAFAANLGIVASM